MGERNGKKLRIGLCHPAAEKAAGERRRIWTRVALRVDMDGSVIVATRKQRRRGDMDGVALEHNHTAAQNQDEKVKRERGYGRNGSIIAATVVPTLVIVLRPVSLSSGSSGAL